MAHWSKIQSLYILHVVLPVNLLLFCFTVENINTRTLNKFTRNSAKAISQIVKAFTEMHSSY